MPRMIPQAIRFFLFAGNSAYAAAAAAVVVPAMLVAILSAPVSLLHAAPKGARVHSSGKYLGKDYIDTTVQRAIFLVNDAATAAGVGFRQREAIAQAKETARRLRAEVKGDPNERYALWKVGELEWLIYLEEKDLVLQKVKQGRATLQQLITEFNAVVGKTRPDFKTLARLRGRMADLEARRAREMDGLIKKRSARVSREVVVALEKALMCGDMAAAEQEFRYCLRNRSYLAVTQEKFDRLEAQVSACERSREEMPLVKAGIDRAHTLLDAKRIGEAREAVMGAKNRLVDIRVCAPPKEARECITRINRCERDLERLEDSLVRGTLDLLHAKGAEAAQERMEKVLRKAGVCNEKIARVDRAIIAAGSPQAPSESRGVSRVVEDVASSAEGGETDVFAEMRKKAKIRAQFKLDSMEVEREKRARIVQAKLDSIEAEAKKAAILENQQNQEKAKRIAAEIYGTIEKNRARVALDLFNTNKPFMHQYLMPEAFALLENTVLQAVDPKWAELSLEIAYLSAAPSVAGGQPKADKNRKKVETIIASVYSMLEHNNVKGARKKFNREKSFLRAYLDKETYDVLATTVRRVGD